jgi:acyl dehydratase
MIRHHFEDCAPGDRAETPGRTITESDLVMFAMLSGDWSSIHCDEEYAKTTPQGGRIAHGLLTLSVGFNLIFRLGGFGCSILPASTMAIAEIERLRFLVPVRIGDTLRLECETVEATALDASRGLLTLRMHIRNQRGEAVLVGRIKLAVGRRPAGAGA